MLRSTSRVVTGALLLALTGCKAEAPADPEPTEDEPAAGMDAGARAPRPSPDPQDAQRADDARAPLASDARAPLEETGRADGGTTDLPPPAPALPWRSDGRSSVIPVLWIEVGGKAIVQNTKIPGRFRVIEDHDGTLAAPQSLPTRPAAVDVTMGIEVRGNSTAGHPKQSFSMELQDAAGMARAASVLGMPAESDWVLYACYNDKTCLRNALMYDLALEMGPRYSVRARYAEMYLDGAYRGLYMVVEKIKRDKNRVVIPEPAADATGDLSGGYMFRREGPGKSPAARNWGSKAGTLYTFHYPRYDRISPAQKTYLVDFVDRFEEMMRGPDWADLVKGYPPRIDLPTWVDWALMQELSKNIDAYKRSAYFVKLPKADGDRIAMGPIWDFDLAFGMGGYSPTIPPDGLMYLINASLGGTEKPVFYWPKIWTDPAFQRAAKCRWRELRKGPLATANITEKIDRFLKYLEAAEKRDHMRWPVIGMPLPPNNRTLPSYAAEVKYLRDFLDARLPWLDTNLPGACP